jgi:hypothetical protein
MYVIVWANCNERGHSIVFFFRGVLIEEIVCLFSMMMHRLFNAHSTDWPRPKKFNKHARAEDKVCLIAFFIWTLSTSSEIGCMPEGLFLFTFGGLQMAPGPLTSHWNTREADELMELVEELMAEVCPRPGPV